VKIDRTHRSWAVGCSVALAGAGASYAVLRLFASGPWSGGSAAGLSYGVAGFAMMVFAALLSARKKFPVWRVGRAQTWMRGHLWLGLLSFPLILFHAGFAFGGPLTRVMMWLFVIVMASGLAGAALQHFLPRIMLERVPMETIYEEIPHVRAQLLAEADRIVADACGALSTDTAPDSERETSSASNLQTVMRVDADDSAPLREFYLSAMRPFAAAPDRRHVLASAQKAAPMFSRLRTLLPAPFHGAVASLEDLCEEERQLLRQERLHAVLHGWLLAHVPLSFALLALAIFHIVGALRY
jgi:hypothetical protein